MKYLKKIDYLAIGIYMSAITLSLQMHWVISMALIVCALHYFPLMYLLRKHGYLDMKDELGFNQTDKMEIMIQDLIIDPVRHYMRNRRWLVILAQIVFLSFVVFYLAYFVIPKLLGLPFLDGTY